MHLFSVLSPNYIISTLGMVGIIAIIFCETGLFFGFFFPGDSLLFTAGFLATQGYVSLPVLLFGVFCANRPHFCPNRRRCWKDELSNIYHIQYYRWFHLELGHAYPRVCFWFSHTEPGSLYYSCRTGDHAHFCISSSHRYFQEWSEVVVGYNAPLLEHLLSVSCGS